MFCPLQPDIFIAEVFLLSYYSRFLITSLSAASKSDVMDKN